MRLVEREADFHTDVQIWHEAKAVHLHGYATAAGCLCRVALEIRMAVLCYLADLESRHKYPSIEDRARLLRKHGYMSTTMFRRVKHAAVIGHRCCHGEIVDGVEILTLIDVVGEVLEFYTVSEDVEAPGNAKGGAL
ncbi:MAG: hypothetical protein WDZ59_11855 [Pirellulales bacterium]